MTICSIDGLPVPLSTVLQAYHSASILGDRLANLFNFFEALTEFYTALLLSGLSSDPAYFLENRDRLMGPREERNKYLKESSLGSWLVIGTRCARAVRELLSSRGETKNADHLQYGRSDALRWFGQPDTEWLGSLASKTLYNDVLEGARQHRNNWKGHGGAVGEPIQMALLTELAKLLNQVRDVIGETWDTATLASPGATRYKGGIFRTTVQSLTGTRVPFRETEVETLSALEDGSLHIVFEEKRQALKVLPLVRMMPSPKAANNTCYFYNRIQNGEARYVSYYYDVEPEAPVGIEADPVMRQAFGVLGFGLPSELD